MAESLFAISISNGAGDMVDNFGNSGFAGHLGDGVNSGCAFNPGDSMASLNGSDNWFDDGHINAMFGFEFSAGSLNGLGDGLGNGISDGSLGFTFDDGQWPMANDSSAAAGDLFASLLVGDFFTDNILGFADVFGMRSTSLDFDFFSRRCTCHRV